MTPRDKVLDALKGERKDLVPVSAVTQVGTVEAMEKAGAHWPAAHSDPEQMVELGTSLYKLAGLETARIPFCLTVQAEALGCKINMGTMDRQPSVEEPPATTPEELPSDFLSKGRIPAVIKATELMKQHPDLPKIVGMEGPYTLAGHVVGIENLMRMMIRKRDFVVKIVDLCTKANIEYAKALLDAGAEVVVPCDPSASPELLSPKDFASIVKPKLKELAGAITKRGGIGVLHICGGVQKIIKDMAETGFDALSIEEKVDIASAKELVGSRPVLVGNISAAKVLLTGTPEQVKQECIKAINSGIDVLAPGCGIAPRTKLENIRALVSAVV
ncbi:MAG: methylcobamide:CoM methyltransferase MtaA [Candidatus Methanosuratincola petrocarbonis]